MLNQFKIGLLLGVMTAGGMSYSCQKHDPAAEATTAQARPAKQTTAEAVKAMAADKLVQDFIFANEAFLNKYDKWLASLPTEARAKYQAELNEASKTGKVLKETFRTEEEVSQHHAAQEERTRQIRAKYPHVYQLSSEEQEKVKREVYRTIVSTKTKS